MTICSPHIATCKLFRVVPDKSLTVFLMQHACPEKIQNEINYNYGLLSSKQSLHKTERKTPIRE
jgi:hypothetical protein